MRCAILQMIPHIGSVVFKSGEIWERREVRDNQTGLNTFLELSRSKQTNKRTNKQSWIEGCMVRTFPNWCVQCHCDFLNDWDSPKQDTYCYLYGAEHRNCFIRSIFIFSQWTASPCRTKQAAHNTVATTRTTKTSTFYTLGVSACSIRFSQSAFFISITVLTSSFL